MPEAQQRQSFWPELLRSLLPITWMGRAMLVGLAVWFVDWVFVDGQTLFGSRMLKTVIDLASALAVVPLLFFLFKAARWVTQHLLWRLRRRLIVTYLLIGALPLVLLLALCALLGWVVVMQSNARLVGRQLEGYLEQSRTSAQALSRDLSALDVSQIQSEPMRRRLQERADALAPIFPAVTLSVRRLDSDELLVAVRGNSPEGEAKSAFDPALVQHDRRAQASWPAWLEGKMDFHGWVLEDGDGACRVYARHLVKLTAPVPMLFQLGYPVCQGLSEHLSHTTDLEVAPGKAITSLVLKADGAHLDESIPLDGIDNEPAAPWFNGIPIFQPVTDWRTGRNTERDVLMVDASFLSPSQLWRRVVQFRSGTAFGDILFWVIGGLGVFFLLIGLVAIGSAVYLTRSITGAVHYLYEGTQRVEAGDFSHEIKLTGRDQLSALSAAFNRMTRSIRELLRVSAEKQRLDQEMKIAAQVQAQLFPRATPKTDKLDFAPGICIPARAVSGDYYDYLAAAPGVLGIVVADVCGKGVSAALMMANLQANLRGQVQAYHDAYNFKMQLRAQADSADSSHRLSAQMADEFQAYTHPVRRIVQRVNQQIAVSMVDASYITFFYAEFDERANTLRYTNAGHNPPLLLRAKHGVEPQVERLECGGMVLGLFPDAEYDDAVLQLERGDLLAAFTDGLLEARNPQGEELGEDRLIAALAKFAHLPAAEIERAILNEVSTWTAQAEQEDDLTLVIFKVR
ncbi:MAG: SpoIIE family protein phosphatase [Acidobacteria bacterium]|nr:SpoIIE family protein phosphatase [Acidobacteriota bacterium]